ncbi:hypothetical protein FRC01_003450, partial [Tulasnella sp. 417]
MPIHNLPREVLEMIFSEEAGFGRSYYHRLFRLRSVCKYWMEIIDSTTELWRQIRLILHPELQAMILRNSRDRTLFVEYDERIWPMDSSRQAKMAAFASLIEPTTSRWKELQYGPASDSSNDTWILSRSFPNLHSLSIVEYTWKDPHRRLDAPKLQRLSVDYGSLNWKSLSGLTYLDLNHTNATLGEFVAVLQASPQLSFLAVQKTQLRFEQEDLQTAAVSKISLPQLHSFYACGSKAQSLSLLLDWIVAPPLRNFHIREQYKKDSEDCTRLFELAGRYIGAFPLPECEKVHGVFISVRDSEIRLAIGSRRITVLNATWTSESGPRDRMDYLASFLKHLDGRVCGMVKFLWLRGWGNGEIGRYMGMLHARFPQINELVLQVQRPDEGDMGVFCGHLTGSTALGQGEEWLFSKLTKLRLDHELLMNGGLAQLLQLIEIRRSARQVEAIEELRIAALSPRIDSSTVE